MVTYQVANLKPFRHGPFDILGGLEFFSGPRNFFRTILEQDYVFRRPFGPDFFLYPKAIIYMYMYRLSRQLMLNSGFRDNYMLNSAYGDLPHHMTIYPIISLNKQDFKHFCRMHMVTYQVANLI